jgi:cadmium resistance protein CadD (predicted permease)
MDSAFGLVALGIIAFASTNVDDMAVLAIFFSDRRFRVRDVLAGQYVGIGGLVLLSIVIALAAASVSTAWLNWLGVLPIVIGLKWLYNLIRDGSPAGETSREPVSREADRGSLITVAAVTFANGGDNIGVYVPIFVRQDGAGTVGLVVVFALMTGLWCSLAYVLTHNRYLGEKLARIARKVAPFALIAIGIAIIIEV